MPTAQDYLDSMDKEAIPIKQLGKWATKRMGQADMSGAKLKGLDSGFTVPAKLSKTLAGANLKPITPSPGLGGKPNWPNQKGIGKYRPSGGSPVPSVGQIRI